MSHQIAAGLPQDNKPETGNVATELLNSGENCSRLISGPSESESAGSRCVTASLLGGASRRPLPCHQYVTASGTREDSLSPIVFDLFAGLGGWAEGFIAEGYKCIGFDIERHQYGDAKYPAQLVLQDVLTIHGSQFKDAAVIVASPPCQEFSYMAMPFSRGKQIAGALRGEVPFPEGYKGSRTRAELTALFDACFRLQREAIEAAGHHIPMVVENVKGAQPWVGPARANYGSFYFWGDVDMVGDLIVAGRLGIGCGLNRRESGRKFNPDGTGHGAGSWFKIADSVNRGSSGGRKVPGLNWSNFGSPGYKAQGFNVTAAHNYREGVKSGGDWFGSGADCSEQRKHGSKSDSRKMASAQIAKIPLPLSQHIAKCYKPEAK